MNAVFVEPLRAVYFVTGDPSPGGWPVEEGVEIEVAGNLGMHSEGGPATDPVLCRSVKDRTLYKIFKDRRDIDPAEYEPTGLGFAGIVPGATWRRIAEILPSVVESFTLGDDEPGGTSAE